MSVLHETPVDIVPAWYRALAGLAHEKSNGMAWPTPMESEYRRTDLSQFPFAVYSPDAAPHWQTTPFFGDGSAHILSSIHGGVVAGGAANENGWYAGPCSLAPPSRQAHLAALFDRAITAADNKIVAWHYEGLRDGVLLYVPTGVRLEKPLVVVWSMQGNHTAHFPHLTVIAEAGSACAVHVVLRSKPGDDLVVNSGAEIYCADGAIVAIHALQVLDDAAVHFGNTTIHASSAAHIVANEVVLGARIAKTRTQAFLNGSRAQVMLGGAFWGDGNRHMDMCTVSNHRSPYCESRTTYKGAVTNSAHSIMQGLIDVDGTGKGTDAYLTNRNLVLGPGARADSIPSLSIRTNDLKCSHGSTTGKLNPDELFYLTSRGLSPHDASALLLEGFFEEIVAAIPDPLGGRVREMLHERIVAGGG